MRGATHTLAFIYSYTRQKKCIGMGGDALNGAKSYRGPRGCSTPGGKI